MAGIVSVSRTDLAQRRKKLRRQRQMKIIQTIWRTFAVTWSGWWIAVGGNSTNVGAKCSCTNSDEIRQSITVGSDDSVTVGAILPPVFVAD